MHRTRRSPSSQQKPSVIEVTRFQRNRFGVEVLAILWSRLHAAPVAHLRPFKTLTASDVHHHRIGLCSRPNSRQSPSKTTVASENLNGLSAFDRPSIERGACDAKSLTPYARKAPNARQQRKRGQSFS